MSIVYKSQAKVTYTDVKSRTNERSSDQNTDSRNVLEVVVELNVHRKAHMESFIHAVRISGIYHIIVIWEAVI